MKSTPDEIFTKENTGLAKRQEELIARLNQCSEKDKDSALRLLDVY